MKAFIYTLILFISLNIFSQQEDSQDTFETNTTIEVLKETKGKKIKHYDTLAPNKAAFFSAVIPGLGQAYNKTYWKIPIVYAALGTGVGIALWNHNNYIKFRTSYRNRLAGIFTDKFTERSNKNLVSNQEQFQKNKEVSILVSVGLYVLNIIDANVTAHLQQFNLNNELSFQPNLVFDTLNNANYGLSLNYNF